MDGEELLDQVDKIPGGDGWWHADNGDTYRALAERLAKVMHPDDVLDILESAYAAAADEFGG